MNIQTAFAISAAGMKVEQMRFTIASLNLSNANSNLSKDGSGFRPLSVVAASQSMDSLLNGLNSLNGASMGVSIPLPKVQNIVPQNVAPRQMLDPGNPAADDKGFVRFPGVNSTQELVNIMTSLRAYEANVVAMNAAKSMAQKALEIGGGT